MSMSRAILQFLGGSFLVDGSPVIEFGGLLQYIIRVKFDCLPFFGTHLRFISATYKAAPLFGLELYMYNPRSF
jgi:hypothetical protein